jgi:hypothetical protein
MAVRWVYRKPYWGELVEWDALNMPRPVGEWWFNDNGGTLLNDASGNLNHGTITGATWTPSRNGSSLDFDGTTQRVGCGTSPLLQNNAARTITVRAMSRANGWDVVFQAGRDKGNYFGLWVSNANNWHYVDGKLQVYGRTLNTWTTISCVHSGTEQSMYVDGIRIAGPTACSIHVPVSGDEFWIGGRITGTESFDGQISHLIFHDCGLSTAQVQAITYGPLPLWQPTYYSIAAAAATPKLPIAILKAYDRRAS